MHVGVGSSKKKKKKENKYSSFCNRIVFLISSVWCGLTNEFIISLERCIQVENDSSSMKTLKISDWDWRNNSLLSEGIL